MSRDLRIRVRTIGSDAARAAIRGVTREAQQGALRQRQASRGRLTDEQRTAREIERVHAQMERGRLRETERSQRAATRAVEREARDQRRAQEREAAAAARAQARSAERRRQALRALPGAIGTAALAAGDAIVGRARGYQSTVGIPSREQLVSSTIERSERIARLSANSGLSQETIQSALNSAGRGSLQSQDDLLGALETAQSRLVDQDTSLQFFVDNIENFGRVARAAGGSTEDWAVAVGQMQNQLGVSAEDTTELMNMMAAAAQSGAIEAGDFAEQFSGILGQFHSLRGEQGSGIGGAREFTAVAQALGKGGRNPAEVRTLMQNMMANLTRGDVQRRIEGSGGLNDRTIFDQNGRLTIGIGELVQRMARDPSFASGTNRQRIFGADMQANEAYTTLLEGAAGGQNDVIGDLQRSSADQGQQIQTDYYAALDEGVAGAALRGRADAEANFAENGRSLVETQIAMATSLSEVETQFPLATEAVGALRDVVTTTAAAFGALNLAMGGSLFGGGAAATGAAGATGATGAVGGGLLTAGALATGGIALAGSAAILGFASSAGGDVSPEQVAAQKQRRDAMLSGSAIQEMARLPQSVSRAEVGRRAQAQFAETGRQLTDEDVRALAEAIEAGAARGVARGSDGSSRDGRVQAGRTPSHTR